MERDSFIFRKKWYEALSELDAATKVQAYEAIMRFALYHEKVEFQSPVLKMAMAFIMPELEGDCKKWIDIREKRSEAGKKGGAPVGNQNAAKQANQANQANDCFDNQNQANQAVYVSSFVNVKNSFFLNMCAAREEKKEEFLFEIGKEMLRKGAAKANKESEAYIAYNDTQGWLLKNGRTISDPVAWAKNWAVKNPSAEIQTFAEAYILMLNGAQICDRKMLDCFRRFEISGNNIQLILSSKKAAEAFVKAEEQNASRMFKALQIAFPEIKNPSLTYITPR